MCLILGTNSEIKIAEENIVCYKVVCKLFPGVYESEFYAHLYIRGSLNKLLDDALVITQTYTTYKNSLGQIFTSSDNVVEKGFHSFTCQEDACQYAVEKYSYNDASYVVVKCMIPKGSNYIKGTYGKYPNYVSSKIICVEELKEV